MMFSLLARVVGPVGRTGEVRSLPCRIRPKSTQSLSQHVGMRELRASRFIEPSFPRMLAGCFGFGLSSVDREK